MVTKTFYKNNNGIILLKNLFKTILLNKSPLYLITLLILEVDCIPLDLAWHYNHRIPSGNNTLASTPFFPFLHFILWYPNSTCCHKLSFVYIKVFQFICMILIFFLVYIVRTCRKKISSYPRIFNKISFAFLFGFIVYWHTSLYVTYVHNDFYSWNYSIV